MSFESEFDKIRTEARAIGDSKGIDRNKLEEVIRNADSAESRHSSKQGAVQAKQLTDDAKFGVKTAINMLTLPFDFRGAMRRQDKISEQHDLSTERNTISQEKADWRARHMAQELRADLTRARNSQTMTKEESETRDPNKNSLA